MKAVATLADEYDRQGSWRAWDEALARLPIGTGTRVLDVGCGTGEVSAPLFARGLQVIGIDRDDALLARARERHPGPSFIACDAAALTPSTFGLVDGVWSSFVAAYFSDISAFVADLGRCVAPGGWLALTEVEDLLGHEPRAPAIAEDLARFYAWARDNGGYGFEHGRLLGGALRRAGLRVVHEGTLPDQELAFHGAASPEVLEAWRARLSRMRGLQAFFGDRGDVIRDGILAALQHADHRSLCRVHYVVGVRPADGRTDA